MNERTRNWLFKKVYIIILISILQAKTRRSSDFMIEISWLPLHEQFKNAVKIYYIIY